ncbi:MAG: calcium-binding protein [Betaproteobacteria bacterium]|nr:calcium-binding protein [Betaproteobacteria bacterium]
MPEPRRNRAREHRIAYEIVVDAYTPDERAIGWHCYLDDKLRFPFKAKCIAAREISPLKRGEEVEVLGMAPADDCMSEMFVLVHFAGRKLGLPLAQLEPLGADAATREAAADWRYWTAMRYAF